MDEGEQTKPVRPAVPMRRGAGRAEMTGAAGPRGRVRAPGSVALVGAGPGDPELLTMKAVRLIERADAIVHDRLVTPSILALAPLATKIYVGKARSRHAMPQESINALLVRLAREGLRVVRLKGGDPFIFGRGGEEIEALAASGVPFEVVPGISAANGVAAYAGIPLTHRDHAQTCLFVTGHLRDGTMDLDWPALARPHQTLVVYMGLLALPTLCRELARHGLPASTAAAVVSQGTTPRQRVVTGTIETLPDAAAAADLESPTLIIIGDVVNVRANVGRYAVEEARAEVLPFPRASRSVTVDPSADGVLVKP